MSKIKVAPSILTADFVNMKTVIDELEKANADMLHLDVMDGNFVPNLTFGMKMVADIRKQTNLTLDCHLMISNPEKYVEQFAKAGADYIVVHKEATNDLTALLNQIKSYGVKCGFAVNPSTEIDGLEEQILMSDMVLIMSVNPGFGGQSFNESVLEKCKKLRKIIDESGKNILIEIDGGVNLNTINLCKDAGVNVVVAGNFIIESEDKSVAISRLKL